MSKRTPEEKAAAKIKREAKFAFEEDIARKVNSVFTATSLVFNEKSVHIHYSYGEITFKQLNDLSQVLGTDAINFNFGVEGEQGYSSYTPGIAGEAGYIEVLFPIPQVGWFNSAEYLFGNKQPINQ